MSFKWTEASRETLLEMCVDFALQINTLKGENEGIFEMLTPSVLDCTA